PCDLELEQVAALAAEEGPVQSLGAWGCLATPRHALAIAYAGQAEPLEVPWQPGEPAAAIAARFDALHAAQRGHAPGGARRILAVRSLAEAALAPPPPPPPAAWTTRRHLADGTTLLDGPGATLRIPPGWGAAPRADGAMLLEPLA
ncbi:hypothetical protein, partial [Falsiroseomonas selenitidurans]